MDKIKILFVIDHLGGGGAEYQLVELLNSMNREQFELNLFLTEGGGVRLKNLKDDIRVFGFSGERVRKTIKILINLIKTIKKLKPDVVVSWLEYSTFLTSLAMITMKTSHIAGIWGNIEYIYSKEVKFGWLKKLFLKFAYKRTDKVIFNSYNLAEKNKWLNNKNYTVIYNIFSSEKIGQLLPKKELRKSLNFSEDLFYIVFVGSLVKRKGVDLLVEAFKMIENDKLRLLIVGRGELEENLKKITKDDKRIEFLGYLDNPICYIKASDLFILPSFSEGIPNVIIETLACETPIIATDVDGIPEIIEHKKTGFLIKPGDPMLIKEAVEYATKKYEEMKKFSEEGKKIMDLFKKEVIVAKFEELFKELASRK